MQFLTVGINYTTAPLALRERVAFPADQIAAALQSLRQFMANQGGLNLAECAILSTCNRTEIYCAVEQRVDEIEPAIQHWLAQHQGLALEQLAPHLYGLRQTDAVRHTFRVASGLDSMVLGEPQILGQLKDAVRDAEGADALGTMLHQLFQRSFSVAKDVRSKTDIGGASVSMAAAAVRLSQRIFERVADQHLLFIGAGEMIELCATHFAAQKPRSITMANRTIERGQALAQQFGAQTIRLAELPEQLARFDIVVSCTAASLPIIGLGMVERAIKQRRHKPMFMVDLAVPRDIEVEAGQLDDVFLYTVDDLGKIIAAGMENRQAAAADAEIMISKQVDQFMRWLESRSTVPAIRSLHDSGEAIRQTELDRAKKMLAQGADPAQVLEAFSQSLTNKFLHGPTQLLHSAPDDVRAHLLDYLPNLFKINKNK